jgi:PAS domain-containing protein
MPRVTTRTWKCHLLPHVDAEGHVVGAFVLITDITRHRRAEVQLRESEERLAKFMHASAEGIVFHKGGTITDVNPPLLECSATPCPRWWAATLDFVAPEQRDARQP